MCLFAIFLTRKFQKKTPRKSGVVVLKRTKKSVKNTQKTPKIEVLERKTPIF